jgi:cytochrome c biogenesis protein CcdA
MKMKTKKILVVSITIIVLALFFILTKTISPDAIEKLGTSLPIPITTIIIALIDGFNPCNLFVLTMLISLLLSESHSRKKILAVGFTFIGVVYIFYFLFMAAWLNIFKYIGFIDPLRIGIAILAIIAGLINIKELFFYRKGVTLMIQDKHVGPIKKRMKKLAELMKKGSMPALIGGAAILAVFASLVELPCTAGFPIIFTGILSGQGLSGASYYGYLLLYNLIYVLPLITIITVLGFTFQGKTIKKDTMGIIKFIGGAIMLLLGIILLVSPALIGLG